MTVKQRAEKYRALFSSELGQEVLTDLALGMRETSFDANPYVMAFNEGKRSVVLGIIKYTKTDPVALVERLMRQQSQQDNE